MENINQTLFLDKKDLRSENRELAFKIFFRELREMIKYKFHGMSCNFVEKPLNERIDDLLKRWGIAEEEIGTSLSLVITFPAGVVRNQWFYGQNGAPYALKHDGKPVVAKKTIKKVKGKK